MKTMFAIRQKSTGFYLPAMEKSGHSFREPVDCSEGKMDSPRLHISYLCARRALIAWLLGIHHPMWEDACRYVGSIEKQEHRDAADMEIVEINLTVKEPKNGSG